MPYQIRNLIIYVLIYWAVIIAITIYDKKASKLQHHHHNNKTKLPRIPEILLFALALIGGAIPMYITMLITHHKTQKTAFKVGMPIIIVLQVAVVIFIASHIRIY